MATRKQSLTETPTPAEAATAARATAQEAKGNAAQALTEAEAKSADLARRLEDGDATVTADEMVRSKTEVERCRPLLAAAERVLRLAVQEEQVCIAEEAATGTPSRLSAEVDRAIVTDQVAPLAEHIAALLSAVEERNANLTTVVDTVTSAGLIVGECNPLSPVAVDKSRSWPVLHVNGGEYQAMGPRTAVADALNAAFASLGLTRITVAVEVTR